MVKADLKFVANYNGHNIKKNGSVALTVTCDYDELTNSVQLIQMLNNNIKVSAKVPDIEKVLKLGEFSLKSFNISHDGTSKITFNSTVDYAEIENLSKIVIDEKFRVRCEAEIEVEDEEEE